VIRDELEGNGSPSTIQLIELEYMNFIGWREVSEAINLNPDFGV
jgi:hypothetical protein